MSNIFTFFFVKSTLKLLIRLWNTQLLKTSKNKITQINKSHSDTFRELHIGSKGSTGPTTGSAVQSLLWALHFTLRWHQKYLDLIDPEPLNHQLQFWQTENIQTAS